MMITIFIIKVLKIIVIIVIKECYSQIREKLLKMEVSQ